MNVYEHEAVKQLAKEFGLPEITSRDASEDELEHLLSAIETERVNPSHYSPDKWVQSFFTFLRQTGKYSEVDTPRKLIWKVLQG